MATIVLARHGKPVWDETTPIPGRALGQWARDRDEAPIDRSYLPPARLVRIAQSSRVLAASPLRRSRESADLVAPGVVPRVDPLFREVFLPTAIPSGLRLPPRVGAPGRSRHHERPDRPPAPARRVERPPGAGPTALGLCRIPAAFHPVPYLVVSDSQPSDLEP